MSLRSDLPNSGDVKWKVLDEDEREDEDDKGEDNGDNRFEGHSKVRTSKRTVEIKAGPR